MASKQSKAGLTSGTVLFLYLYGWAYMGGGGGGGGEWGVLIDGVNNRNCILYVRIG